jgi:hypothetical protein
LAQDPRVLQTECMKYSAFGVYAFTLLATTVACSDNSQPSSPSGVTASVAAPRPVSPANTSQIRNVDQPATLVVQNAVSTQTGTTYTFEVATDPGFAAKVQIKDGVSEGSGGQTTVKLDTLTPNRDYYWHARATSGGTAGVFGTVYKFTVGPAVTIDPPAPIGPLSGTTTQGWPAFIVANSTRSSSTGALAYRFEISTTNNFSNIIVTATVAEQPNRTSFTPSGSQPAAQTPLYWRATAIDQTNNISSAASAVQNITYGRATRQVELAAQIGQTLWPGAQPAGANGHATMGEDPAYGRGWSVQTLYYAPQNVTFQSPDIEMLRYFDLFDRGFDPESAIGWMRSNGYPTEALWYPGPEKAVLGLRYVYLAARGKVVTNATWDNVLRVE